MSEQQEHILFLTGKLAEKRLHKILEAMQATDFTYEVENIGVNVAALMTAEMIKRRLTILESPERVILPGLCRGDLPAISEYFKVPFIHGPIDLKDIPVFFGHDCQLPDLSKHDVLIFAEIVDAPNLSIEDIVARASKYQRDGANVIDIGCLPDTPFPHLEECVVALHEAGFKVSIDSLEDNDLLQGGRAGADYLLSLSESTLWIADEVSSIPVLIPDKHGDMESMYRVIEKFANKGKPFFADCILDPIHFGFTESIVRYRDLRQQCPDIQIMMGVGNLTELTEADTTGINAILFGIISELGVNAILATEVSPHARSAVREADFARRMMYAAKQEGSLPKGLDGSLLTTHARKPFPYSVEEIEELASEIRDPSYRIQVSEAGIHVYNRDGIINARNPFELFPDLDLLQEDAPHAFYMGVELARAQIAWQLGKRYMQDEELEWGVATEPDETSNSEEQSKAAHALKKGQGLGKSSTEYKSAGSTLQAKKKKINNKKKTKKKITKKKARKKIKKEMMINESIITTLNEDGSIHIAPMGVRRDDDYFVIAPFKPSTTLKNLERSGQAVINMTDDVRIFAGCLTGHYDWPAVSTTVIDGKRLEAALSHIEIEVAHQKGDDIRPVFYCSEKHQETHAPFMGLNRAKAAVLEAAVLVSRLHILPDEKITNEIEYLQIAIDKTASEYELEAWSWLMDHIKTFREQNAKKEQGNLS